MVQSKNNFRVSTSNINKSSSFTLVYGGDYGSQPIREEYFVSRGIIKTII